MFEKKKIIKSICAVILTVCMFVSSLVPVHAAEYVDDLDLVDYITDIVIDGEEALVTYQIPTDPHAMWYGAGSQSGFRFIGSGGLINFSQDITTNTYQSFKTSVVVGTFTPVASGSYYAYERAYTYSDDLKNITHMMFDGVLYQVSVTEETDTYIVINDSGDNYSFRGCYFYKDSHALKPNSFRTVFNDNEEHTIIFGTIVDVTEVVRDYLFLMANIWPLGKVGDAFRVIDVSDLKAGANFDFSFSYDYLLQTTGTSGEAEPRFSANFYDENFELVEKSDGVRFVLDELTDNRMRGTHTGSITVPEGAAYFMLVFQLPNISVMDCRILQLLISDLEISCYTSALDANSKSIEVVQNRIDDMYEDISNLKDQMQGVQDSVDDLNQGIQDSNEKLDGIQDSMDDANDKLDGIQGSMDDANDKLDDLPGEIGDEFQNVMDAEKDQAGAAGNEFVDQILDVLPDSSTEILGALKGLTDAMSYTGTEAVIPIPGITLPGIDGLIPRTQIWGGVDFDLGEYVAMMPDKLLSLVRSLFTIAIVLFCAYELKGIVSYCLTLKENKGG